MKKASQLIEELFSHLDIESEKGYISLFHQWEQIAGSDAAQHSSIKEIEGNEIIISVDHPAWSQMILLQKNRILNSINSKFPELGISKMKIVLG